MDLWLQFLAAAVMVIGATLVHGLGLLGISKLFRVENEERLEQHPWDLRAVGLMVTIALAIFTIHVAEVTGYALFFRTIGAFTSFEEALFYSAASYATLGYDAQFIPEDWRLLVASEALVGFLLLGWSTAFLVRKIVKLRR